MAYNYEWPYTDPERYNDDWLLTKMKQLASEWEQMKVKFTTLEEYVKNYFANLNLQDEVNKKIDAMIADGSFASIINNKLPGSIWGGTVITMTNSFDIHSLSSGGYTLFNNILQRINIENYIALNDENYSLMSPSRSYYRVLEDFLRNNTLNERVVAVFVLLDKSDFTYDVNLLLEAMRQLNILVRSSTKAHLFFFNPLFSSLSITSEEVEMYRKITQVTEQIEASFTSLPTHYLITGSEDIITDGHLTIKGLEFYATEVLNKLYFSNYSPYYYGTSITTQTGVISLRPYLVDAHFLMCKISITITNSIDSNFRLPIVCVSGGSYIIGNNASINLTWNSSGMFYLQQVKGDINTTLYGDICINLQ